MAKKPLKTVAINDDDTMDMHDGEFVILAASYAATVNKLLIQILEKKTDPDEAIQDAMDFNHRIGELLLFIAKRYVKDGTLS